MHVILLSGSPAQRSRGELLLEHARRHLEHRGVQASLIRVRDFTAEELLHARFDSPAVRDLRSAVEEADGLIVATPVYKASFSGALKVLLDLLPERVLADKVVLPLVTGGSPAHLLAVDYALKPVLSALKAQEVLTGVFAVDAQIAYPEGEQPARFADELGARLDESLDEFFAALNRRIHPLQSRLPNDRSDHTRRSF